MLLANGDMLGSRGARQARLAEVGEGGAAQAHGVLHGKCGGQSRARRIQATQLGHTTVIHPLRRNRPRIAISSVTVNTGITTTTNMPRARNPNASNAPPIRGPAMAPARPRPSAQPAPVERMAGG